MSKVLALLSGKGGSGKTTLALSIASMLSNCRLKVLLVDCDLSTNGATYFYEGKLSGQSNILGSFYRIYINKEEDKINELIKINEYMDFMPSIVKITKTNSESYRFSEQDYNQICLIDEKLRQIYDVIIYDCQAGYTDVLKLLLPYVDVNLVVMEADAISSAAIRSFYLKIGDILNEKKVYQIFNKTTDEEYEIYSKVSGGTVFTNIETVMFDWKIRKAFSIAQIPDMEKTSARYCEQIYNICKILFTDDKIQERIMKYDIIIKINKNQEQVNLLRKQINEQNLDHQMNKNKMIKSIYSLIVPIFASLLIMLFLFLIENSLVYQSTDNIVLMTITLMVSLLSMVISVFFLKDFSKEKRYKVEEMNRNKKELDKVLSEKSSLEKQLDQLEKSNSKQ